MHSPLALVVASFVLGGLVGLIPLLLGIILRQVRLGLVGFLFSVVAGFLTGFTGPLLVAIGFGIGISVSWHRSRSQGQPSADL
jgi:hypothetical protein